MTVPVLFGPDPFRAREAMKAIRDSLDSDGNLGHNTTRLEGRGLSPADLRAACHAASFFVQNRLVIVGGIQGGTRRHRAPGLAGGIVEPPRGSSADAPSDFDQF